jgi:saccharopine dehydrogenase-like NADP-dependent oxidoreductase
MKSILILGAGLSASSMIRYLLEHAEENSWMVRVVDRDQDMVKRKINGHPYGEVLSFNAIDPAERRTYIKQSDVVISMLPARYHVEVARDCIALKKNLITPSYISPEMHALDAEAKEAGILIMNEIGVDPGLDHMSAMKIIHHIEDQGGELLAFRSFCGGLIAPESDDNPWQYKFTWNPRNVVLAGQGGAAKFIEQGEYKYIPYSSVFERIEEITIDGFGDFDGYANRDSLSYRKTYGLDEIPTIYRGTLRRRGFCEAWNVFVELGMTDDSYSLFESHNMSPRKFVNSFLPYHQTKTVEEKFHNFLGSERSHLFNQFEWLGLFDDERVLGLEKATPAQLLENILIDRLSLSPGDKDMLVMYHEFDYLLHGKQKQIRSSMICLGADQTYTAMSDTVGLPVGMMAKLILKGEFNKPGIHIPVDREVYKPILSELKSFGISFQEIENDL